MGLFIFNYVHEMPQLQKESSPAIPTSGMTAR